ncbi:hypothetical protein [Pseudobutyrivibrio ruminis]|uniref:hypothetical protein n=1 Tax=Pseudobutyrivibrio ruminis TaxID=46206 RepID=UPI00051B73DD|nr:hypothetical protein [Pseudobutyrivibrio ruminis]
MRFENKTFNEPYYAMRLEDAILLDGKDIDISSTKEKIQMHCLFHLLANGAVAVAVIFLFFFFVNNTDGFIVSISLILILIIAIINIATYIGVSVFKRFKGICCVCDNIIKTRGKNGTYYAYHCTTELGEHGIAFVNSNRNCVEIGDRVLYLKIGFHDLIYKLNA